MDTRALEAAVRMRALPTVMHLDADSFFAAVEARDKPSLRGKPILVGGVGPRGVVATASYEARKAGARSAMSMAHARRLVPAAAVLAPRFDAYRAYSDVIMNELAALATHIEPLSIDEAFADLEGTTWTRDPAGAGAHAKEKIRQLTGLTVSVGVGRSKLIAKIASDARKPDGLVVIDATHEDEFLLPLPVRAIPGVGPVTAQTLERFGIRTVADLRARPLDVLASAVGENHATSLYLLARALDDRPVAEPAERKSVGCETTYTVDVHGLAAVSAALDAVASEALRRLADRELAARTVVVKVRRSDFTTQTRSVTFRHPTVDPSLLREAAHQALAAAQVREPVRLLGVAFHGLSDHGQLALDLSGRNEAALDAAPPAPKPAGPQRLSEANFRPGIDVEHPTRGRGWAVHVRGRTATIRFETVTSAPATSEIVNLDTDPLVLPGPAPVQPM